MQRETRLNVVEEIFVFPEDVPTATCSKHVLVDFCTSCDCAANEYCVLMSERTGLVLEKKGLLKLTQKEIDEILAAANHGLHAVYTKDEYVYLVKDNGADDSFKGFRGGVNRGVDYPYKVCTEHTKAVWETYLATHPETPELPGNTPGGTQESLPGGSQEPLPGTTTETPSETTPVTTPTTTTP